MKKLHLIYNKQCSQMQWLWLIGLLYLAAKGAVIPSRHYNREFITGYCSFYSSSSTQTYSYFNYTNTFYDVIGTVDRVYYTMQSVAVNAHNYSSPTDSSKNRLDFQVDAVEWGNSYLVSQIKGYVYTNHFYSCGMRYLAILINSQLFSGYVEAVSLQFVFNSSGTPTNTSQISSPYPSNYTNSTNMEVVAILRDVRLEYLKSGQNNAAGQFKLGASCSRDPTAANCSIQLMSYMYDAGSWFIVRYLLIIYDSTVIAQQQPHYNLYSNTLGSSSSVYLYPTADLSDQYTTLLCGNTFFHNKNLNWGSFNFYVTPDYTDNRLYYTLGGSYQNRIYASFSYWATNFSDCPSSYTYNISDKLCYDGPSSCSTSQYWDYDLSQCFNCSDTCLTCYSATECKSCDPASRYLFELACHPLNGFYESNTTVADACLSPCSTCSLSATNCTSCDSNLLLLVDNQCFSCSDLFQGCELCSESTCLTCNSSYHKVNDTYCNILCDQDRCAECLDANSSHCVRCKRSSYTLVNGYCQGQCGDGQLQGTDECDDGNLEDKDGCSSSCLIEDNYNCTTKISFLGFNYTAFCSFLAPVGLTFLTLEKLADGNSLRVILQLNHYQESFWRDYKTLGYYFTVDVGHKTISADLLSGWSFSNSADSRLLQNEIKARLLADPRAGTYADGEVASVQFEYTESLEGKTVALTLSFTKSRDPRVNTIPSETLSIKAEPDNNHYVNTYSTSTYDARSYIYTGLTFICLAYFGLYLIGFFFGSMRVAAEGLMVAQVIYVGLASVPVLTPLHSALTALSSANNPYNIFWSSSFRPFDDPLLPNRLRGTEFYTHYLQNLNTSLIIVVLPLFLGFFLFFVRFCSCVEAQKQQKIKRVTRLFLCEYVFADLILVGCVAAASSVLEFKYGLSDMENGMMGIIVCGTVGAMLLLYCFFWLRFREKFGEFRETLKDGNARAVFVLLYFLLGPAAGAVAFLLYETLFGTVIVLVFSLMLYLLLFAFEVYRKTRDKLRVMLNTLTIVGAYSCFLVTQLRPDCCYSDPSNVELLLPLTVLVLVGLNFIVNMAIFIYLLVKRISVCYHSKENEEVDSKAILEADEEAYCTQRHEQVQKLCSGLKNPLKGGRSPQYIDRFIYESERQKTPLNSREDEFRNNVNSYLEYQKEDAQKTINCRIQKQTFPRYQGQKVLFSKFKYTAQQHLVEQQYEDIDKL